MLLTGAVAPSLTGCGPPATPYPAALQSQRPEERIRAIKRAGETKDRSVIGILVDRLEDEDEAVRLYAILALEKLTGTRLGYDYAAREGERARAVKRWRQYLVREPPAADTHAGVAP
jgi:HEAT repeat protein